jgi:hypothetical protein
VRNEGDTAPPPPAYGGWFSLAIGNAPRLQVTLSAKPAAVSGVVTSAGQPVIGVPVYLAQVSPDAPGLTLQTWTRRADEHGSFAFHGLPPGTYRLVSSFDLDADDPLAVQRAIAIILHEGDQANQPLEMVLP